MSRWRYALNDRVLLTGDYTTQPVESWRVIARCRQEYIHAPTRPLIGYTLAPWVLSGDWALDRAIAWVPEAYLTPHPKESQP